MGTTAWSHHMAGDARPCHDLRGVGLDEMNSTLPEIPPPQPPLKLVVAPPEHTQSSDAAFDVSPGVTADALTWFSSAWSIDE